MIRFEDLSVWQTAAELYEHTDGLLKYDPSKTTSAFQDQLDSAVISVSNDIAEGFERGRTIELFQRLLSD